MEICPDYDTREVARTVALAISNLQHRNLSDSCTDETPLVTERLEAMNTSAQSASSSDDREKLYPKKRSSCWRSPSEWIQARYVLTLLGFLGFCNVYALRVNLSVAMVAMVNWTAIQTNTSGSDECSAHENVSTSVHTDGEFIWSSKLQSTVLGSFFYGYIVTQVPGGRMAEIFGGKWLFGIGVLCTSIFTLLTPVAARLHVYAFLALRVLEGLGEGVTFPAMHCMLGRWVPKFERSLLATIVYSGAQIGTVIAMPMSGVLSDSNFLGGWPSVFYVFGFLGCLWFVVWTFLVYDSPEEHPRISTAELNFIKSGTQCEDMNKEQPKIPWREVLTSIPLWALIITHFGQNWGFYTLLTELPTYFSTILHFDIKANGFLSALPYLLQAISSWVISYVADVIRRKQICSVNVIRKTCNSIAYFGCAVCFFGVTLVGCNKIAAVVLLTLAMGLNGASYAGYMVTHVDMSPAFAGTLMGMTNCVANLAGFLAPLVVGALTENHQTLYRWQIVFYIAITVYIATGILFIVCGSARLQPWDASVTKEYHPQKVNWKDHDSDVDK